MRVPPSTRPIHIFVYIIALMAHPSLGNCLHIPPSLRSVVNETFTLGGVRAKQGNTLNWMDWSSVMTSLPNHKIPFRHSFAKILCKSFFSNFQSLPLPSFSSSRSRSLSHSHTLFFTHSLSYLILIPGTLLSSPKHLSPRNTFILF